MTATEKNLITCVEFGTHAINVLHGTRDSAGNPVVLGFGSAPSDGCICKGEIIESQFQQASAALGKALHDADKSAGITNERRCVYSIVNGAGITSRQGEGQVMIYEPDHKVHYSHIAEAVTKAQNISLSPNQVFLSSFDSYFLLDSQRRVQNPEGETAKQLDAFLHIIAADRHLLETQEKILREQGFEDKIIFVSSNIASVYACLQEEEKDDGVLLIDMGAGVTDYIVVYKDGITASGVLPVGTENIANDLAIGLDLNIDYCRKLLQEQTLTHLMQSGTPFLEIGGPVSGTKRKIPVGSFERIIDLRVREIFSILKERLDPRTRAPRMEAGIVFCGGGSLLPGIRKILTEDMRMPVRIGQAIGISGAMTGLEPAVRYTALLGLLKYVIEIESNQTLSGRSVGDVLEDFSEILVKKVKDITKGFKI